MVTNFREVSAAPILTPDTQQGSIRYTWVYLVTILGAGLYSLKAIFIKLAYQVDIAHAGASTHVDAITLIALRFGFALPAYVLILCWLIRYHPKHIPIRTVGQCLALGLLGYYLCAFLDFTSLKYITAQLERMILFTYPAFMILLGALFFNFKLRYHHYISIVCTYLGLALIFAGGDIATGKNVWLGSMLVILTAIGFALFQLLAKHLIDRIGSDYFTCLSMLGASIGILVHFSLLHLVQANPATAFELPPRIYMLCAIMAIVCTIIPSFLINIAIARVGAQMVAILAMSGPVITIIAAIYWLSEPFGIIDGLGTCLTMIGIATYTLTERGIFKRTKAART